MVPLIIAGILIALGVLGCFVAKIPGPLLAWIGVVILYFTIHLPISWWMLWLVLPIIVIASMIITSKYAPKLAAKVHEFGKAGKWGTFTGSLITLLLALANMSIPVVLVSLIALPYLFAFLFEFISVKSGGEAAKRAGGSYVLFLLTTLIKLIVVYICFLLAFDNTASNVEDSAKDAAESISTEQVDIF